MEEKLRSLVKTGHIHRRDPQVGQASEFYFACRNGNIDKVKEMLPKIPYDQLNKLEANGSTPLHAATYFGHGDIVRLLIQDYRCPRHLRNLHGLTAYQEAQTDEMQELFRRPANENRFNDHSDDAKQPFEIVTSLSRDENEEQIDHIDNEEGARPDHRYLTGYEEDEEVKSQLEGLNGVKALFQTRIGRSIMEQGMKLKLAKETEYGEEEFAYVKSEKFREEALQKVLDEHVTPAHPEYKHCCHLLQEYVQHGTIESLLRLYTLETPFYRALLRLSNPLGFPLFIHLADLKQRYYQGYCYRGVQLTRHELNEYYWALRHKDSVLSVLTFSSTSIERDIAEQFSTSITPTSNKIRALLIFYFPQLCDTAINLSAIPEHQLPCISNYENEKEVLVGPRTFFRVTEIEEHKNGEQYTIHLENLPGRQKTVLTALKFFLSRDLKQKTNKLFHH